MPCRGVCHKRRQIAGFTLIELMVVLVVIGVLASMAVLSVNTHDQDDAQQMAQKIAYTARLLRQEAVLKPAQYGLQISRNGYRVLAWSEQGWQAPEDDRVLAEYQIPQAQRDRLQLSLEVDGRALDMDAELPPDTPHTPGSVPAIVFLSTGEATAFQLEVRSAESHWRVSGKIIGELVIEQMTDV